MRMLTLFELFGAVFNLFNVGTAFPHLFFSIGYVTFYQINTVFRKYIIFFLLAKCLLWPGEMASQVG